MTEAKIRAANLPFWQNTVEPQPLGGGISNFNFTVTDGDEKYVVRIGGDVPVHHVFRVNEVAASRAAFAADISPELVYVEPGALVLRYIEGTTLTPEMVRERAMLERIVALMKRCHDEIPKHLRGPLLAFWVFHVIRDYRHTLTDGHSRSLPLLTDLLAKAEQLEAIIGSVQLVFCHNDLLAANIIDDGVKLWLIDWEYGGFNSPLFDLGGLASNNELTVEDEEWLLDVYFEQPVTDELRRRYQAMKCASLLRETMWSMVSEIHSELDFDYASYTDENLQRFNNAWQALA